jgi:hypothetical protein
MLLAPSSSRIDSCNPNGLRDRDKLRVNLRLVFRDRDLLALHFPGNRQDLQGLLLGARGLGSWSDREQGHGEKGGESGKAFHGAKSVRLS